MEKLNLAEEIIKNCQSYKLGFIDYKRKDNEIFVSNRNGYFNDHQLISAIEFIQLDAITHAKDGKVEIIIWQ